METIITGLIGTASFFGWVGVAGLGSSVFWFRVRM